ASIDIGTNTFRLLISDLDDNGILHPKLLKREITRLGGGFTAIGALTEEAMTRGVSTLSAFTELLKRYGVKKVRAVATSVVREAINGEDFLKLVKNETGLDVEVIGGEEEASLALKGVLSCVTVRTGYALAFDIGGGSTEYILSNRGTPLYSESFKLGVVHATERFLKSDPPKEEEVDRLFAHVEGMLRPFPERLAETGLKGKLPPENKNITLGGTAGTITTLAAMDMGLESYDPSKINNHVLTYETVKRLFTLMLPLTLSERKRLKALEGGREDLIIAGTIIVLKTMEVFGFEKMMVSDGGLLEGVLIEMVSSHQLRI
ncbi:MAG: Ppx/GppA phosphatase family protein, partial [Deltaproteobacteria bacterium]